MIGDEGSGYWIGLEALRAGLRARDRGAETCLLKEIQEFWGLGSLGELVAYANAPVRPQFAELTELVVECAGRGDRLALGVLERAGEELAGAVSLVASKMVALGCEAGDVRRVAFAGSVLEKIGVMREAFAGRVRGALPGVVVGVEAIEPLEGALWRARRG